jgi:hypothetical protein
MRNVEYITNGFGGLYEDAVALARAGKFTPQSVNSDKATIVRNALISYRFPNQLVDAAANEVTRIGPVALNQAIKYLQAYYSAAQALNKEFETLMDSLGRDQGMMKALQQAFEVAASKVPTNRLCFAIRAYVLSAAKQGSPAGNARSWAAFQLPADISDYLDRARRLV